MGQETSRAVQEASLKNKKKGTLEMFLKQKKQN